MARPKSALRVELLFYLTFLAAFAILVGVATSQLVRSEKLASIGRHAAGLAHEVGNPLGAIGTYVEVLRRRGADPEVMAGLTRELERVDRIVRSLLDYARPQEDPLVPVDPDRIVRAAFELLRAQGAFRNVSADA